MIDRYGRPILIGYSEKELVYLRAAMALPRAERFAAFQDIADLTGRLFSTIQSAAYRIHAQDVDAAANAARTVVVAHRTVPGHRAPLAPSDFKWPSRAQLMAGKARSTRRPVVS